MAGGRLAREGARVRARAALPFLVAGLTVALIAALASADRNRLRDPNDVRGVLDVRHARWEQVPGKAPAWTVFTFNAWRTRDLWDRGWVFVQLDTKLSPDPDYYVLVRSLGSRLDAELFRIGGSGRGTHVADVGVGRPSGRAVTVRVPLKELEFGPARDYYLWRVVTMYTSDVCPRTCLDRVPDQGGELQWRPGMSPTPSPTASPSQ
jgi:hypothetical protein